MSSTVVRMSTDLNIPLMHRIAEMLLSHDAPAFREIDVAAHGTTVTLRGRVVGAEEHARILALTQKTTGVTQVVDRLRVVRSSKPKPAHTATADLKSAPLTASPAGVRSPQLWGILGVLLLVAGVVQASVTDWSLSRAPQAVSPAAKPAVVPVEGTVLYEGKPATGARLVFYPLGDVGSAHRAHAVADDGGRFRLSTFSAEDGAVPGTYAITIDWIPPCPPGGDPEKYSDLGNLAPKRFQRHDLTPLRARVAAGGQGVRLPALNMTRAHGAAVR